MVVMKHPVAAPLSTATLHERIHRLYDHLYANAQARTPAGIGREVGKLLHTAMFLEQTRPAMLPELGREPAFQFTSKDLRKLASCDASLCHVVAQHVRDSFKQMNDSWQIYPATSMIHLEDKDIGYVCGQLNGILISDDNRDVFGDALEVFRGQWAKRESGQFFTDQRVTSLAMVLLQFDPRQGDDLIDICSGTGGFLLAGLNHIRFLLEQSPESQREQRLIELAQRSLKGQEIDTQVAEVANATLAARLANGQAPLVSLGDSLQRESIENTSSFQFDSHLCAATNPPFGTKITVKDPTILRSFQLAQSGGRLIPRAPDTLFIEQNLRLLKPGEGRLAIVVPYQILSGPQALYVREWLLKQAHILAVVDLPPDTFQPHTGTKGVLLVVKRRKRPLINLLELENESIFMAIPRWIGHDRRGNPIYKRAEDGSFTGEILSDFEDVGRAYHLYLAGGDPQTVHSGSFRITSRTLLDDPQYRLNALYHKPSTVSLTRSSHPTNPDTIRTVLLKDVVKNIFYPTRFKRNYVDYYPEAVPFLGGSNISQLITTTDKWLRHDDPKLEELRVSAGWILITRSGSTGIISTVPVAWDGFAMSEHIIRIIPDPDKLDPNYLHAFLRTPYAKEVLARGVFGSVIDEITPEFIGSLPIPLLESDEVMQRVVKKAKRAQRARDKAIISLLEAVEELTLHLQPNLT